MTLPAVTDALPSYERRKVFATAAIALLSFGIVVVIIGTILPVIIDRFGISKGQAGSLLFLLSVGMLVAAGIFGPVVDRYGFRIPMLVSMLGMVASVELLGMAASFRAVQFAAFATGMTGGIVNGAANALVSDISGSDRGSGLSILGVFFGFGAFSVPLVMGLLLQFYSYDRLLIALGLGLLLPAGYIAWSRFPPSKQPHGFPVSKIVGLLRDPALILLGVMLFLQSGLEMLGGGWSSTLLAEHVGLESDRAVGMIGVYWIGLISSRAALGSLLKRFSHRTMLKLSVLIAVLAAALMIGTDELAFAIVGLVLLGIGFGGGYPIVLSLTGARFPDLSGTAFGAVFFMGLIGGSLIPFFVGIAADFVTLRWAYLTVPLLLVVQLVLLGRVREDKTF